MKSDNSILAAQIAIRYDGLESKIRLLQDQLKDCKATLLFETYW